MKEIFSSIQVNIEDFLQSCRMLKVLTFLFVIASVSCFHRNGTKKIVKKRMVDSEYTDIKDVPYIVQIIGSERYKDRVICGGTIISKQWIVTAAHCVTAGLHIGTVLTGHKRSKRGQKHTVENILYHEDYDASTSDNDIALIKVAKPIPFSAKQHAIPIATRPPKPGDQLKVSGFGQIGNKFGLKFMENAASRIIKTAVIPVISNEECEAMYSGDSVITSNMFCAGRGGDDSCQGDSGGPAVIDGELFGVVAGGNDCGNPLWPGVYTRLQPYLDWILDNTETQLPSSF